MVRARCEKCARPILDAGRFTVETARMKKSRLSRSSTSVLTCLACMAGGFPLLSAAEPAPPAAALDAISAEDMLGHVKTLAGDEFEGRAPGSRGEELTVNYLTAQFKALGLRPGNPDGTYVQEVPHAGLTSVPSAAVTARGKTNARP